MKDSWADFVDSGQCHKSVFEAFMPGLGAQLIRRAARGNRAVRVGKWKLVSKWTAASIGGRPIAEPIDNQWELYDIDADRTEMHDLAAASLEKVQELAQMWQAWAGKVGVVEWLSWDSGEARSSAGEKS